MGHTASCPPQVTRQLYEALVCTLHAAQLVAEPAHIARMRKRAEARLRMRQQVEASRVERTGAAFQFHLRHPVGTFAVRVPAAREDAAHEHDFGVIHYGHSFGTVAATRALL